MAVTYCKVSRKNPSKPTSAARIYAQAKSTKEVTLTQIAEEIQTASSATKGDVQLILDGVITCLTRHLSEGEICRLGEFGSFRVTIINTKKVWDADLEEWETAAPVDPKNFSASRNIARCRVRFEPGDMLNNMTKTAKYREVYGGTEGLTSKAMSSDIEIEG